MLEQKNHLSAHAADAEKETVSNEGNTKETMIIICIPICILGLVGNGMVILFLRYMIKKNKFNVYVMNMAMADFVVILYLLSYFALFVEPAPINAHTSRFLEITYILGRNSSFYILTALCAERYLSLFSPVWCQHHRPENLSAIVSAILWAFSCVISFVEEFTCYPRFYALMNEDTFPCDIAKTIEAITDFLIFVPIMVFCTMAIFIKKQEKTQTMLDKTIAATVILFLIFDASARLLEHIDYWHDDIVEIPVFTFSVLFDSITSSINPFLYFAIGWWSRQNTWEALEIFVERALNYETNTEQTTQADEEET
ncbi:mas-related G-protein coupled receptor member H-like [Podarcis raffonei]|uniref:mas-related G-protein coupled receptor member H-like n=1 Tax=Podarcis raffonei TaxID=65483 RepID=UPI0023299AFD|nr:mas-related G-protein coupled receptor member H-like [Podarcis raffonei]